MTSSGLCPKPLRGSGESMSCSITRVSFTLEQLSRSLLSNGMRHFVLTFEDYGSCLGLFCLTSGTLAEDRSLMLRPCWVSMVHAFELRMRHRREQSCS